MTDPALARPLAADGVVHIDSGNRTLTVRPAADASGYTKLVWRDGVREMLNADYRPEAPTVSAAGAGKRQVSYGLPTDDNALEFRFAVGDPVYRELVSTPGLRATIVVDRASRQILSVAFRGRA